MNRLLKTLLLWLVAAVLPLQAVGASMRMSCGPVHHKAMEVALDSNEAHHHDGTESAHSHHHDASQVGSAVSDTAANDSSSEKHQHSTCSSCTATCIGAAGPPFALNLTPTFDGSEMITVSPASLVVGTTPSNLERPPKRLLA